MTLTPPEIIERILISTTSRFVGEYKTDLIEITHAWPNFENPSASMRMSEGPLSRSAFVVSFKVPEVPRVAGAMIPTYENVGEKVCSLLSLLYGKRFDSHGSIQSNGQFRLPHLDQFNSFCSPYLPQNDHQPRSDIATTLNLTHVARLSTLIANQPENVGKATALTGAANFYRQALLNAEGEPEVAYLHLITAGEILANSHIPESDDLIDENFLKILEQVRQHVPDGEKAARALASSMRQIKRRFRLSLEDLVDDEFFYPTKDKPEWSALKRENFSRRIAAAYDIRSRYVHTGISFGKWIAPSRNNLEEAIGGKPMLSDDKLAKLLQLAPTYVGLERVIRYCLFRFAERHKLIVNAQS